MFESANSKDGLRELGGHVLDLGRSVGRDLARFVAGRCGGPGVGGRSLPGRRVSSMGLAVVVAVGVVVTQHTVLGLGCNVVSVAVLVGMLGSMAVMVVRVVTVLRRITASEGRAAPVVSRSYTSKCNNGELREHCFFNSIERVGNQCDYINQFQLINR